MAPRKKGKQAHVAPKLKQYYRKVIDFFHSIQNYRGENESRITENKHFLNIFTLQKLKVTKRRLTLRDKRKINTQTVA